jgi:hypothetical protein
MGHRSNLIHVDQSGSNKLPYAHLRAALLQDIAKIIIKICSYKDEQEERDKI